MDLNVYLRGGGTRLPAYLGALRQIEEQGGQVRAWAGVSGGGLLAAVLASGYDHEQAVELMMNTDVRQFSDLRPWAWFRHFGIYAGRKLEKWLKQVTEARRFKDLDVPLAIMAMDINTHKPFIFSNQNTPDVLLATAIRCSVGVPGLFAIRRLHGRPLIDGGLVHAQDRDLFPPNDRPTVTMRIVRDQPRRLDEGRFGLGTYIRRLAELLFDAVDNARVRGDEWKKSLIIQTGHYAAFDFKLTNADKQTLYQMGYDQCRQHLDLKAIESGSVSWP